MVLDGRASTAPAGLWLSLSTIGAEWRRASVPSGTELGVSDPGSTGAVADRFPFDHRRPWRSHKGERRERRNPERSRDERQQDHGTDRPPAKDVARRAEEERDMADEVERGARA